MCQGFDDIIFGGDVWFSQHNLVKFLRLPEIKDIQFYSALLVLSVIIIGLFYPDT